MFVGVVAIATRTDGLIRDFLGFQQGRLQSFANTWNGPRLVAELRAFREDVAGFKQRAEVLLADPDAHLLDPDRIHNLNAIVTEVAAAVEEIDEDADPEKKWVAMNDRQKKDATQSMPVDAEQLSAIAARLRGHRSGEPPRKRGASPQK